MEPDNVGKRIKRLREERKISQRTLARAAGITQSMLSQIERGLRRGETLRLDAVKRLAFRLGVGLDALAGTPFDNDDYRDSPDDSESEAAEMATVGA